MGKYRTLALNTVLFGVNAIATKLITFILLPLYTSYMSSGEYGITDMSLTVINLVMPLATLSIAEAAVRYIVGDKCHTNEYVAISISITVLSVLIVACLSPFLDFRAFGGLGDYKWYFLLAYATSAMMNLLGEISRGMGEIKLIPICAGVSSLTTLVLAVVLISCLHLKLVGYFISVSVGPLFAACIYLAFGGIGAAFIRGFRNISHDNKANMKKLMEPMLMYSIPLIPNNLFWWLSSGLNRLFITGMIGIAASGLFAAASKIPSLLNTVYMVFQQAWQLSAYQESNDDGLSRYFTVVFSCLQAVLTVSCSILSLMSPYLAKLLLRGDSFDGWKMISILLIANLFGVFSTFYGTIYSTTMHTSYVMFTTLFGAVSCVVFTPLLIPFMGVVGACFASVLGQFVVFIMRVRNSKKYITVNVQWRYLVPTLLLLGVQAVVIYFEYPHYMIIASVCLIIIIVFQILQLRSFVNILIDRFKHRN
ncbi:lipopolysaccharide biosynthesis protein [Bifidobacterium thermophilum]|uniref:lipopolysaccharide biosynthesis protein n=1 Tax=Bifidobacterium thermophilum TaxID=33905 RepID=UPI0039951015